MFSTSRFWKLIQFLLATNFLQLNSLYFAWFCSFVFIYQLLKRVHHGIVIWEEEAEWNRQPCINRIHHHSVFNTLILVK